MLQQILSRLSQSSTLAEPKSNQDESPEARYTLVIRGLLEDAYKGKHVFPLVNVLTWALAGIAHNFGSIGIADILGRLGSHLRWITERDAAQAEADAAKRAGVSPQ